MSLYGVYSLILTDHKPIKYTWLIKKGNQILYNVVRNIPKAEDTFDTVWFASVHIPE